MAEAAYIPEAYNSLPGLKSASQRLQDNGGESIITGPIRDIFLRHKVNKIYGVALLHKHFQIQPTERLVDIRNVSSPWETGGDTDPVLKKYNGVIVPRSLRFLNGDLLPYEFDFSAEKSSTESNAEFLQQLSAFFHQNGLDQVLGLRLLESRDPDVSVEVTEGTSNIMLPQGAVDTQQLIPAMWVFSTDGDDYCSCVEYCYEDRGGSHTGDGTHGCG
ncbi:hypothetical protein EDB80DRAFT_820410 [Ilyonectria destructans]|nr:hypothetical protein EDB80DRAFT_820410 [Ilyonectria destructans]